MGFQIQEYGVVYKMKKLFLFLILALVLITPVNAIGEIQTLGCFKANTEINLIQTCASCTFNDISAVSFPNSTILISNVAMERDGARYNFTLNDTQTGILGEYIYDGFGDLSGTNTSWAVNFFITPNGECLDIQQSLIVFVLMLILFGLDLLVFFIIHRLDKENFRDDQGIFIGISIQKYLRVILIGVSYGLILITLNLMNAAATATQSVSQFAGIIGGIFLAMLSVVWVWTIIIVIWLAVMAWRDGDFVNQMKKKLKELEEIY